MILVLMELLKRLFNQLFCFYLIFSLFRFSGFNELNKEDQTELKKKFGSSTVNLKRKGGKISNSVNENGDAPQAKQAKTEINSDVASEQEEIRQKKVCNLNLNSILIMIIYRNKVIYFGNIKML